MRPEWRDSDVTRELGRRAAGEWRPERILPAVRRVMDEPHTERVATSRWAALAALVGLLGVLILVAVALPRLDLAPAAPSPTPAGGIVVLSTEEFAARLAAGELHGQTVLVEGEIVGLLGSPPPGELADWACPVGAAPPDRACWMGTLAGTDPALHVYSRQIAAIDDGSVSVPRLFPGEEGQWPVWYRSGQPVSGVLLVNVTDEGQVEFAGRVREDVSAPTTTVADVAVLDVTELDLDEVVLVDGWLTQVGGAISCRPPDPGTVLEGLPDKWCGNPAWIAPEPVAIDPSGFSVPDDFVSVQHGAYFGFAEDPAADEDGLLVPRRGTYSLARRLYGGGCPDASPPCWDWAIVARLSGSPSQPVSTPAPPVTPAPNTPPAEAPPGSLTCRPYVMAGTDPSPGLVYPSLDIQLSDQTHTVVDCAYFSEFATLPEGQVIQPRWNDVDELGLTWNVAHICPSSAQVELRRDGERYIVTVEQGEIEDCGAAPGRQAVIIWFDGPAQAEVDASMVDAAPPGAGESKVCAPIGPAIDVSILDQAGLVLDCSVASVLPLGVWSDEFRTMVVVRNLGDDQGVMQAVFPATACDSVAVLTYDTRSLDVFLPDQYDDCGPMSGYHTVTIQLSQPVPAHRFGARLRSASWSTEAAPALPGLPRAVRCHYDELPEMVPSVGVHDSVGIVAECSAFVEWDAAPEPREVVIRSVESNASAIELVWRADCFDRDLPAVVQLAEGAARQPVSIHMERGREDCVGGPVGQGLRIGFDRPVSADELDVWMAGAGFSSSVAHVEGLGEFVLTISADHIEYVADEPIDVEATLTYHGATGESVDAWGNGLLWFRVERVDGSLEMESIGMDICQRLEPLEAGVPRTMPFWKGGYALPEPGDPNGDFLRRYWEDPELRLPAGVWQITATSSFGVSDCEADVRLEASFLITVR